MILCIAAVTEAEYESELELTKDTPYLALSGELWGVCYEDFGDIWLHYKGTV